MNNELFFSKKSDEWSTPQILFDNLNKEFNFNLDVAATKENAKCKYFYTINDNALLKSWIGICFCNPPYSKCNEFVKKAYEEKMKNNANKVVLLLPARTDTKWFHEYVLPYAEIRFIKGRLKFGNSKNAAPFPSMIVIF